MFKRPMAVLVAAALITGCGTPVVIEDPNKRPLPVQVPDRIVAVYFDVSGSMDRDSDRAFDLVSQAVGNFFRSSLEGETRDRLLICQLSGAGKDALLWEGSPLEFRKIFSPGSFKNFLRENSSPSGSRIFDGVREGIDFVLDYGVKGKTQVVCLVCSDMEDNASEDKGINFLLGSLHTLADRGGVVGLYFVSTRNIGQWQRNLRASGFKEGTYVVQGRITHRPEFPAFTEE